MQPCIGHGRVRKSSPAASEIVPEQRTSKADAPKAMPSMKGVKAALMVINTLPLMSVHRNSDA